MIGGLLARIEKSRIKNPSLKRFPKARVEKLRSFFSPANIRVSSVKSEELREIIVSDERKEEGFRFKNAWETGKTSAGQSPFARFFTEIFRLGLSMNAYRKTPHRDKPHYMYLQFKKALGRGQTGRLHLARYGDDIWVFKTEAVLPNISATVGDSYSYKAESEYVLAEYLKNGVGDGFQVPDNKVPNPMRDPHEVFLPYLEYRDVLVRHYLDEWNAKGGYQKSLLHRKKAAEPVYIWENEYSSDTDPLTHYNYFEIQAFDPDLTLDKVLEFTFTKNPPSAEFLRVLEGKGIKVFDGRDKRRKPAPYRMAGP